MSVYMVALGVDVHPDLLAEVVPQPRSDGVVATRIYTATGVVEQAPHIELVFGALEGPTEYRAVLTQFGVLSALYAPVTILAFDPTRLWWRYSGVALRPEVGQDVRWDYFPRNVTILVRDLDPHELLGDGPVIP